MMSETTSPKKILIVEDESTIREVVRRYLEREGFEVQEAADGYEALDALALEKPDLIVLDIMLPGIDGLTITRQLRRSGSVPIILLTARGETSDRIRGLDIGADDYMVKPFSPQELVSRVHAVLRRSHVVTALPEGPLEVPGLKIDPSSRSVQVGEREVGLTIKEFDLLWFMCRHPRQVFSRDDLLDRIWGLDFEGDPSTVTVHIRRLREKIENDPSEPRLLHTVWGVGYRFEA